MTVTPQSSRNMRRPVDVRGERREWRVRSRAQKRKPNDPLAYPVPKALPGLWRRDACQPNQALTSRTQSFRMSELWSGCEPFRAELVSPSAHEYK
jgi:hypothetical protein